jgi:hypothetical protein
VSAAFTAGRPWLDVYCPGYRTSGAIDIRTIDRHPRASVGSLVSWASVRVVRRHSAKPNKNGATRKH